jgi:mono/diheme cytochrome c family protein
MRISARTGIVVLAATFSGIALAVFVGSPAGAVAGPGIDLRPALALQAAPDAETAFLEQCAPCHGTGGEGGVGPSLTTSTLSAADRVELIRSGRNAMPAFEDTLGDDAIEALSIVLGRLAATATYAQQCAPCHGVSGEGGIGPALLSGDLSHEDARSVISEGEGAMPAFRPTLTDDQLDGVTSFVQNLPQIQVGSELYARLCTACHGATGEGGAGPALAGSDVTADKITAVVSEGAGTMPAFGSSLTDAELEAVIAFTRRLVTESAAPQPPVATGAELYVQLCVACHGADGEGGAGPPLAALGLSGEELSTLIVEGQGSMPGFGSELADEDLDGLVEYLQSTFSEAEQTATGAELYVQLCAACHGADGEGGAGPPLAALGLNGDELSTLIAEGQGSMPGFATQLSADDVTNLTEFLVANFGEQDSPTTTTLAGPMLSGVEMYADHCANCHAVDGSGDLGPDLRDTELSLNEVISRIYGGHAGGMPAFEGELTGLEVQEVARFVTNLRADRDDEDTAGSPWLWPVLASALVVAALAVFVLVRRSQGSKTEVSPEVSEES